MDVDDTQDQEREVVYMELLDPSPEIENDLPDVKKEITDEELLANSHEIDDADEEWESLKHSYPPKSSKSNIGMVMLHIENCMENHGKSVYSNWKEPLLTSSEPNLKKTPGSAMKDKLRRTFRENKYPFLKESFVSVERLPKGLTATEVTKYETANKVKMEEDIEIVDKPNDLSYKEDPPPISDPKHETAFKFADNIDEQMKTISRSTRKGLESQYSVNDDCPSSKRIRLAMLDYGSSETTNLTSQIKSVHKNLKPFKCLECNFTCSRNSNLTSHIISVHEKLKPFKCSECNNSFTQKCHFLHHIKSVHQKIKPFKCLGCNYSFSRKCDLIKHIKSVHQKLKRFKCNKCNYASYVRSTMFSHIKSVHEKIKPFKNSECNNSFIKKGNLAIDTKSVHEKIKPFICSECKNSFTRKSSLVTHVKSVHEKQKPFKCFQCNHLFTQKSNLLQHIKSVHEKIKPFKCSECNNSFTQKGN